MSAIDMDELRELRDRVRGAEDDKAVIRLQLATEKEKSRRLEAALEEVTNHRNRLLWEKESILTQALAPILLHQVRWRFEESEWSEWTEETPAIAAQIDEARATYGTMVVERRGLAVVVSSAAH